MAAAKDFVEALIKAMRSKSAPAKIIIRVLTEGDPPLISKEILDRALKADSVTKSKNFSEGVRTTLGTMKLKQVVVRTSDS